MAPGGTMEEVKIEGYAKFWRVSRITRGCRASVAAIHMPSISWANEVDILAIRQRR